MKRFFNRVKKDSQTRRNSSVDNNVMIALIALLTAFYLINDRLLRINFLLGWTMPNPAFSLSIVAIVIAGYIMGVKGAVTVAALGQLIGPAFWPIGGPIWPELTASWVIIGLAIGFFTYRGRSNTHIKLAINLGIALIISWAVLTFVNTAFTIYRMGFGSVEWYTTQLFPRGWRYFVQNIIIFAICFPLIIGLRRPIERFIISDEEVEEKEAEEEVENGQQSTGVG